VSLTFYEHDPGCVACGELFDNIVERDDCTNCGPTAVLEARTENELREWLPSLAKLTHYCADGDCFYIETSGQGVCKEHVEITTRVLVIVPWPGCESFFAEGSWGGQVWQLDIDRIEIDCPEPGCRNGIDTEWDEFDEGRVEIGPCPRCHALRGALKNA